MHYSEEEIFAAFKDKICLYKEGRQILQVLVKSIIVDDWGVKFELEICSDTHASIDSGDLEYIKTNTVQNRTFQFSGAWEVVSFGKMRLYVAYVNGELNANPESFLYFKNRETNFFKLWRTSI